MDISICILTYNGEKYLKEILQKIFQQKINKSFEVIVIDSGSTDSTIEIVKQFTDVNLIQIPNQEFGHAKTRNLAIKRARGEIVCFLVQDATPYHNTWLKELTKHFKNPDVMAVFGRHIPRSDAPPFIMRDTNLHFDNFSKNSYVYQKKTKELSEDSSEWHKLIFFSDVNCALRKKFAIENPYPKVDYAEDQLMGKNIISSGFTKVYSNTASVYHSHNYPLFQYFSRYFDEYNGLKKTLGYIDGVSINNLLPDAFKTWFAEIKFVLKLNRSIGYKLYWIIGTFISSFSRKFAALVVKHEHKMPRLLYKKCSMEYWSRRNN